MVLSELNQGGWADEETGEIFNYGVGQYTNQTKTMYGEKGTVLWPDDLYVQFGHKIVDAD